MGRALVVPLILLLAGPAGAAVTGLALIPTADTLAPRQYRFEYQTEGRGLLFGGVTDAQLQSEFGLGFGEVGVDYDLPGDGDAGALLNAKVVLRPTSEGVGVAVGVLSVGKQLAPVDYLVVSASLTAGTQLSVGVQRTGTGANEGFAGVAQNLSGALQLYAETIAGEENAGAVTLAYQVSTPLGMYLGWQHPHDGSGDGFLFDVNYTGVF